MFCPQCGKEDTAPSHFCASCGSPLKPPSRASFDTVMTDAVVSRGQAFLVATMVGLIMFVLGCAIGAGRGLVL
jgi:uncharacterized membrane protein YvbJ